jgi:thiol-disulfide isomerase/thioredoxin
MRIIQKSIVLIVVLVAGLFSCSSSVNENKTSVSEATSQPNEAKKLPAFAITDASGNTVNLSSFKGKKVFVNLWATWCPPCRAEIPSIEALAGKVNKEEAVFIMLSLDENFELAKKFAKSENLKLPVYYPVEKLPAIFNTDGIPATFIFNEEGELIKQNNGADDYSTDAYIGLLTKKTISRAF